MNDAEEFTDEDIDYEVDPEDLIDDEIDDAFFATQEEQEEYNKMKDYLTKLMDDDSDD